MSEHDYEEKADEDSVPEWVYYMSELSNRIESLEQAARHPFAVIESIHVQLKSNPDHNGSLVSHDVPIKFYDKPVVSREPVVSHDPLSVKDALVQIRELIPFDNKVAKDALSEIERCLEEGGRTTLGGKAQRSRSPADQRSSNDRRRDDGGSDEADGEEEAPSPGPTARGHVAGFEAANQYQDRSLDNEGDGGSPQQEEKTTDEEEEEEDDHMDEPPDSASPFRQPSDPDIVLSDQSSPADDGSSGEQAPRVVPKQDPATSPPDETFAKDGDTDGRRSSSWWGKKTDYDDGPINEIFGDVKVDPSLLDGNHVGPKTRAQSKTPNPVNVTSNRVQPAESVKPARLPLRNRSTSLRRLTRRA